MELRFKQRKRVVSGQTSTEMAHTRFSCDDSPMKHVFKISDRPKCMEKIVFVVIGVLICIYVSSEKGHGSTVGSKVDSVYRI